MAEELFLISVAAQRLGLHPQTLRKYERLGLVQPTRTMGSMRVYSAEELERGDGMSRGQTRRLSAEIERLLALLGL
jgi:DNA-binding transcriptional MerR regulator